MWFTNSLQYASACTFARQFGECDSVFVAIDISTKASKEASKCISTIKIAHFFICWYVYLAADKFVLRNLNPLVHYKCSAFHEIDKVGFFSHIFSITLVRSCHNWGWLIFLNFLYLKLFTQRDDFDSCNLHVIPKSVYDKITVFVKKIEFWIVVF